MIIPNDVASMDAVPVLRMRTARSFLVGVSPPVVVPSDLDLRRAAEILNAGEKVAMLVGAGALGATTR